MQDHFLRRWDINIFAYLLNKQMKHLPLAGDGGDSSSVSIDVDAVIPALSEKLHPYPVDGESGQAVSHGYLDGWTNDLSTPLCPLQPMQNWLPAPFPLLR